VLWKAEGVGFEPTMTVTRHTGFQDQRTRPLCEPSRRPALVKLSKLPIVEDTAPLAPVALATPTRAVPLSAEFALLAPDITVLSAPETSGTAARQ
jgi:hypothetical protein